MVYIHVPNVGYQLFMSLIRMPNFFSEFFLLFTSKLTVFCKNYIPEPIFAHFTVIEPKNLFQHIISGFRHVSKLVKKAGCEF